MIEDRKLDHIWISLKNRVESDTPSGFGDITAVHRALPETNLDEIDLSADFFGKTLKAPIVIAGMTGGHEKTKTINEALAIAAQEMGVAIGVGSQRAGIENKELEDTYSIVRDAAPDAFVIANIGAVQLANEYGLEEAERAVDMIKADALAVHLNPLQEAVQPEGDRNFTGCIEAFKKLKKLKVPIIAKETGAGISRADAVQLERAGVSGVDVGGLGGTSFSAVESYREGTDKDLARLFHNWGVPTAVSTVEVLESTDMAVISTGGIRNGIEVAKALSLGAHASGMALPFLKAAMKGEKEVKSSLSRIINELRTAMFLMGAEDVSSLQGCDLIISGSTREWLIARGIDYKKYANRTLSI